MRPALRPGLVPIWRDKDTVQLGVDPRRAVAIAGMRPAAEVIRLTDGSRLREQLLADASERGIPVAMTERVLTLLAAAGALIDYPAPLIRSLPPELRNQLIPELTAASLAGGHSDGGAGILARRAATRVAIHGAGALSHAIADLLTRSGLACLVPWPGSGQEQPAADLVVLTSRAAPELLAGLHRSRTPHLAVSAAEAIGVVGPLVRPGMTACLRCLDLTRAERDPAWPLILAQLSGLTADQPSAVLTGSVAAQAAAQVLAFADQGTHAAADSASGAATSDGTLELVLPAWQWRRRSWQPHPACICATAVALTRRPSVRTARPPF